MDKIKKQFKDFWQYFKLVERGAGTSETGKRFRGYIPSLLIMIFAVIVLFAQMGLDLPLFAGVLMGAAMGIGISTAIKPSALSVAPFSPKQRMVFSFLSTLLAALIAFLFIVAISAVFLLIIAFIDFCIYGENMFSTFPSSVPYSAYGNAFGVLVFTLFFFAAYAIFHLERKRNVVITSVIFFVLMEVFALVMTNLCINAVPEVHPMMYNSASSFSAYADVRRLITCLSLPWLPILFLCIFNVAAIAASVIMSVRRYKSDKV